MTLVEAEQPVAGNLGRYSIFERLLERHVTPVPELVSRAQYDRWSDRQRSEFNERRAARIAASFIIETPALQSLKREIRRSSLFADRPVGRTGVILSGKPASGKTTGAIHAGLDAFDRHVKRYPEWKRLKHRPVIYIEVPPNANGKKTMGRFMHFLQLPVLERLTLEARTQIVTNALTRARPSLIIIDEMQNLSRLSEGHFESAQTIKNLLNSIPAVPLYVGFDLDKLFGNDDLGGQFAGRSSVVELNPFSVSTPTEQQQWDGVIQTFEDQFALLDQPEGTLIQHADYLWRETLGSLGALSRLLTTAALDLILDPAGGKEELTVGVLERVQMDLRTQIEKRRTLGSDSKPKPDGSA